MIEVFVTSFDTESPDYSLWRHLHLLPAEMEQNIVRYKRWQDRQRALLARLVLRTGLESLGFSAKMMREIRYDEYGRPWIGGGLDFNISHSGQFVLCAITCGQRVGIDIEAIRAIELGDFDLAFSAEQLDAIQQDENPVRAFFNSWTKKESASKADGRGLSIPLREITIEDQVATIGDSQWQLSSLAIHPSYCCCLASEVRAKITITELNYQEEILSDAVAETYAPIDNKK